MLKPQRRFQASWPLGQWRWLMLLLLASTACSQETAARDRTVAASTSAQVSAIAELPSLPAETTVSAGQSEPVMLTATPSDDSASQPVAPADAAASEEEEDDDKKDKKEKKEKDQSDDDEEDDDEEDDDDDD
ncbi:MAG: hypothetical protein F6J97_19620 [Leptolyngbya sp. SIO4C1]|nr:hypothetical protein [Leptolyngbya sp. SIO4C1]